MYSFVDVLNALTVLYLLPLTHLKFFNLKVVKVSNLLPNID